MIPIISDISYWFRKRWYVFTVLFALAVWGVVLAWPGSGVEIVFCDVGQGDGTLIQQGFRQALIDGGQPGRALRCLEKFMPFFDRTIDVVVVSHPQLDHFGGLEDVFKRYDVTSFVYNGVAGTSTEWQALSAAVKTEGARVKNLGAGEEFKMGDVSFTVVWPRSGSVPQATGLTPRAVLGVQDTRDPNETSLVLQVTYAAFDALLTGDIESEQEQEIKKEIEPNSIEVLKVPHHGSKYSSSQSFLEAVRPALAVIQVGKNSYGHPTKEAIERLESVGARVLRNDQDGDIVIKTDGKKWGVKD